MKRKQRVRLRSKVRQERWNHFRAIYLGKIMLVLALCAGVFSLKQTLLHSNFFMIKSVEVPIKDEKIGSVLKLKAGAFAGKSLFAVKTEPLEKDLQKRFPALASLEISRSWPDRIKVEYALRRPFARLKHLPGVEKARGIL